MGFEPIETQEQLDALIADRLKRERETVEKKYGDYDDLKKKADSYDAKVADYERQLKEAKDTSALDAKIKELNGKIAKYESDSVKTRIANELGLPHEIAQRLSGDDEESIRKDAKALAEVLGNVKKTVAPLRSTETHQGDDKAEAYRKLVNDLKEKE
ncbi:MAG: DUF4355 domain-containing protein [Erysipelotrichaceae bacterium]|nr:DUF4355 domain-containing protein [Erysipelotrichaceae bacterium]